MKTHLALILGLLLSACSSSEQKAADDRICAPGVYSVCTCRLGGQGTRRCNDDGFGFGACTMAGSESCVAEDDALTTEPEPPRTEPPRAEAPTCPGKAVNVVPTAATTISGDTSGALSKFNGSADGACLAAANNPEHVYAVTASVDGQLTVKMTSIGFDGVLYARSGACADGAQVACGASSDASTPETIRFNAVGGDTYWIFADGKSGTGPYRLDMNLVARGFCGNGKLDPGEGCDDKNKVSWDGCGNDCQPEGDSPTAGQCPGMPIAIWDRAIEVSGSTETYANSSSRKLGTCTGDRGTSASDRVYAVSAKKSGVLKVETLRADFALQLYARSDCASGDSQVACAANTSRPVLEVPVNADSTYHIVVDGASAGAAGNFGLRFSIQ